MWVISYPEQKGSNPHVKGPYYLARGVTSVRWTVRLGNAEKFDTLEGAESEALLFATLNPAYMGELELVHVTLVTRSNGNFWEIAA